MRYTEEQIKDIIRCILTGKECCGHLSCTECIWNTSGFPATNCPAPITREEAKELIREIIFGEKNEVH